MSSSPEMLNEAAERYVAPNKKKVLTAHLFLDIGSLLTQYGDEEPEFAFSRSVDLGSVPKGQVRLFFKSRNAAISFESEVFNRAIIIGRGGARFFEGRLPVEDPFNLSGKRTRVATWLEIKDFQRLTDFVTKEVKGTEAPRRTTSNVVDRMFERSVIR